MISAPTPSSRSFYDEVYSISLDQDESGHMVVVDGREARYRLRIDDVDLYRFSLEAHRVIRERMDEEPWYARFIFGRLKKAEERA